MNLFSQISLYLASLGTLFAALLHFYCLYWGAEGYRILGAGESIVKKAKEGHWYPNFTAITVGIILTIWSLYAFSAVTPIITLPFTKVILSLIATVFLLRGVGFPLIKNRFKGNSDLFWYVSSSICLILGSLYAIGAYSV